MKEKPIIRKENVTTLLDTKFIKVFDLNYAPGRHYYDATRRDLDNLLAVQPEEAWGKLLPDAATCFIVLKIKGQEPKLLLTYEYRYPAGQFLLSPVAGLMDQEDRESPQPLLSTARREIFEEAGIRVKDSDQLFVICPMVLSTPGMTDESNGLVGAVIELDDLSALSHDGAEGTECFGDFVLLSPEEADAVRLRGTDEYGKAFSAFTWMSLLWFTDGVRRGQF